MTQESQSHDTILRKERRKQALLVTIKKRKQGNHPIPENTEKCGLPIQWHTTHILKIILIHIY